MSNNFTSSLIQELFDQALENDHASVVFGSIIENLDQDSLNCLAEKLRKLVPDRDWDVSLSVTISLDGIETMPDQKTLGEAIAEKFNDSPLTAEEWFCKHIADWDVSF